MTIGFTGASIGALILSLGVGVGASTVLLGIIGFFATGMLGLVPIALQLDTPGNMRGLVSGINLMIGNLLGMGIGRSRSRCYPRDISACPSRWRS